MMKTMKMMLAFVAGALVLSACSNDDSIINDNVNENGAKLVTLTAYQEGEGTRAAIDGTDNTKIDWTSGDQINYFGAATGESMTLKTGAGTTSATFEGTVTPGSTDYVLYPYQSTASCTSGVITAEVPMTQYAVAGSFDPKAALMVGQVNAGSVEFKNVMSYVKVTIPEGMNCKQVSLKAKDAWTTVAGKVKINATDASWAETDTKEGQAFVRLVPQDGDDYLTAGASYYIAILPQTMSTGFELIFNDNDEIKVKQSGVKEGSSSVEFGRSKTKKLGAITSFTYTVGTTDLTKPAGATYSALKMADRNIGAAETTAYGDYFAWGALRPAYTEKNTPTWYKTGGFIDTNTTYYSGSAYTKYNPTTDKKTVLDATDDIVAMLWGGNWRMATKDEWANNISQSSVKGLPLAGNVVGTLFDKGEYICYYWSSTCSSNRDDNAQYLYICGSTIETNFSARNAGFSIRPVLATQASSGSGSGSDPNLLAGEFTVNKEGKKVKFTKSNLYWNGSAFAFETNQYDYPTGSYAANHVGHFFWTNWTDYNKVDAEYKPYASAYCATGRTTSDEFWCGEAHKLEVAGTQALYALSMNEWDYLINTRTNASSLRKNEVNVDGKKNCCIIAPDGYSGTIASSYTAAEWATAEADGLVCLPSAGYYTGSFSMQTYYGYYCASTPSPNNTENGSVLFFYNSPSVSISQRYMAYSIRLVKTVE